MEIHSLLLQSAGELFEDCEDRLAVASDVVSRSLRAIVADGATSTSFSGKWAGLLVEAYCDKPFTRWEDVSKRAEVAATRWASEVFCASRPWHALKRAELGAAAAIAAVEIMEVEGRWIAAAVGDSCFFHIRANRIIDMLPAFSVEDFGDNPLLISTNSAKNTELRSAYLMKTGSYLHGDRFVLATDAAAESLVRTRDRPNALAAWLTAMCSGEDDARRFIEALRKEEAMRNDDVAMIAIVV